MFFRLALAREVVVEPLIADFAMLSRREMLDAFFGGAEFVARFVTPVTARAERPWPPRLEAPTSDLLAWAAERLPLSAAGRRAVRKATQWPALLYAVLSDPILKAELPTNSPATEEPFLSALRSLSRFDGGLEQVDVTRARGWLFDGAKGPARVEIWVDGAFLAAGLADGFRRDVQHRFGGDGRAGFDIALPRLPAGQRRTVMLDARTTDGSVIGQLELALSPPSLGPLDAMRADLTQVRATLERLEEGLPALVHAAAWPLSRYDQYFDVHYRGNGADPRLEHCSLAVLVDGVQASARALEECLSSVFAQSVSPSEVIVVVSQEGVAAATDLISRAAWRRIEAPRLVVSAATSRAGRLNSLLPGLDMETEAVLITHADAILAPTCVAEMAAALAAADGAAAVYADEDQLDPATSDLDVADRSHCRPNFRSGPDLELLRQTPYVGQTIAFRRTAFAKAPLDEAADRLCAAAGVLALIEYGEPVRHLPRLMTTLRTQAPDEAELWGRFVARTLEGTLGEVEPYSDILGCEVPGAVRIRHPARDCVRATIVIPTRDRLDLLRPCIDSLIERRASNRVLFDILVIDHACEDPEAVAYLAQGVDKGLFSVMPFEGPFNWALMNNMAAAQAQTDVLVFLNDDVVALSPDWLDVLAGECLRPDVGVVGCRLLYEDGTLQHAGFVTRDQRAAFAVHEGVGVPGRDGGYLGRHALARSAAAVTGACMAVATETFKALGGFDAAALPVEYNDVDLCFRARSQGLKVIYTPYATLYHLESKSRGLNTTPEKIEASTRAGELTWARWGLRLGPDQTFNAHFARTGHPFELLRPPGW